MSDWTPGPWYNDGYRIYAPTDDEDKRNGRMVVEYKHVDNFNYADAKIIAKAPEMAELLRKIVEGYEPIGAASRHFVKGTLLDKICQLLAELEGK